MTRLPFSLSLLPITFVFVIYLPSKTYNTTNFENILHSSNNVHPYQYNTIDPWKTSIYKAILERNE
jgi:hypothetical protein